MFEIIEIFKRIRKIILHTFQLGCYGVFDYGMNKAQTMQQGNPLNTFHAGILSNEFKNIIKLEEKIKKVKKGCESDLYFTQNFYRSARVYLKERTMNTKEYPFKIEQMIELQNGQTLKDVAGIIVPDEPIHY